MRRAAERTGQLARVLLLAAGCSSPVEPSAAEPIAAEPIVRLTDPGGDPPRPAGPVAAEVERCALAPLELPTDVATLRDRAISQFDRREYDLALASLRDAKEKCRTACAPRSLEWARILNDVGFVELHATDFKSGIDDIIAAVEFVRDLRGRDSAEYQEFAANLREADERMRKRGTSRHAFLMDRFPFEPQLDSRSECQRESQMACKDPDTGCLGPLTVARKYSWRARSGDPKADFVAATHALDLAQAYLRIDDPELAGYLSDLGSVLQELGDVEEALALYARGEQLLVSETTTLRHHYQKLSYSVTLLEAGRYAEAAARLEQLLALPPTNDEMQSIRHEAMIGLGLALIRQGETSRARSLLREGYGFFGRRASVKTFIDIADIEASQPREFAPLYLKEGEPEKALALYERKLETLRADLQTSPWTRDSTRKTIDEHETRRIELLLALGRAPGAADLEAVRRALLSSAERADDRVRHSISAPVLTAVERTADEEILVDVSMTMDRATSNAGRGPFTDDAFLLAARMRFQAFDVERQLLARAHYYESPLARDDVELWRARWSRAGSLVRTDSLAGRTSPSTRKAIVAAQDAEDHIFQRIKDDFDDEPYVDRDRVLAQIPEHGALVIYFIWTPPTVAASGHVDPGPPRYGAHVARGSKIRSFDLGITARVDAVVTELQAAVDMRSEGRFRASAAKLHEMLVQPLWSDIAGAELMLISPEGSVGLVPFAALQGPEGWLIEQVAPVFVDSLSTAPAIVDREPPRGSLIVAAPDFRSAGGQEYFRDLPAAMREGESVRAALGDATLLVGGAATESTVHGRKRPRILHLATHGYWLGSTETTGVGTRGLVRTRRAAWRSDVASLGLSGIAFAGANVGFADPQVVDDGILTAMEARTLDLRGTDMVVLSSCQSGLGHVERGKGLLSLRRALALAGARSQLSSLWRINDQASEQLIRAFYANLAQGVGRAAALRAAQLASIREGTRDPFIWAPFVQSGDWGPLEIHRSPHDVAAPASARGVAEGVVCELDYELLWTRQARVEDAQFQVKAASGVVVVLEGDDAMYGLDLETGVERWRADRGFPTRDMLLADDQILMLSDADSSLRALSLSTGASVGKHPDMGEFGWLVAGGGEVTIVSNDAVVMLQRPGLAPRWRAPEAVVRTIWPAKDLVLLYRGAWKSTPPQLTALDAASGAVRWVRNVDPDLDDVTIRGTELILLFKGLKLQMLDLNGEHVRSFDASTPFRAPPVSSPISRPHQVMVLANNAMYIHGSGMLTKIALDPLAVEWRHLTQLDGVGVATDGRVVALTDGSLKVLEAETECLWGSSLGGSPMTTPTLTGSHIVGQSFGSEIAVFRRRPHE